jgi:hypothetical protein
MGPFTNLACLSPSQTAEGSAKVTCNYNLPSLTGGDAEVSEVIHL